jgi:hydrogenase expression/formation protein HypC
MCLGIPAQLVAGETGHPDLVMAEVGGMPRTVNVGLLDERPGPGDWILVHMGFALNVMTPEEAADALAALGAEREAERDEAGQDEAGQDEAGQDEAAALHAAMDAGPPQDVIARWMS